MVPLLFSSIPTCLLSFPFCSTRLTFIYIINIFPFLHGIVWSNFIKSHSVLYSISEISWCSHIPIVHWLKQSYCVLFLGQHLRYSSKSYFSHWRIEFEMFICNSFNFIILNTCTLLNAPKNDRTMQPQLKRKNNQPAKVD